MVSPKAKPNYNVIMSEGAGEATHIMCDAPEIEELAVPSGIIMSHLEITPNLTPPDLSPILLTNSNSMEVLSNNGGLLIENVPFLNMNDYTKTTNEKIDGLKIYFKEEMDTALKEVKEDFI